MRLLHGTAAALALTAASAAALANPLESPINRDTSRNLPQAQPVIPGESGLNVGIGVICNTSEQAVHYVNLRERGTETMKAVHSINEEANDPKACGVAAVAYLRDKTTATTSLKGRVVHIVRINVFAGYDGKGWARVPQMTQYAIIQSEGVAI